MDDASQILIILKPRLMSEPAWEHPSSSFGWAPKPSRLRFTKLVDDTSQYAAATFRRRMFRRDVPSRILTDRPRRLALPAIATGCSPASISSSAGPTSTRRQRILGESRDSLDRW